MAEERERGMTFWGWIGENPITAVMILLIILGGIALLCGYREGFMSILTGLFSWTKGNDAENKQRLTEARQRADIQYAGLNNLVVGMKEQQAVNDQEVTGDVENAKAECDGMDIDELVDIGNAMLADHGAFRS
jgi:hypothetical protein